MFNFQNSCSMIKGKAGKLSGIILKPKKLGKKITYAWGTWIRNKPPTIVSEGVQSERWRRKGRERERENPKWKMTQRVWKETPKTNNACRVKNS